jgi:hypothetical protein
MTPLKGFWCYVHDDDDFEDGRIADLARRVAREYEMVTAEPVELFLDRDDIQPGDNWKARIDESLSSVAFFIPVITPKFFLSAECRRELNSFADRARKMGVTSLIIPVLFVDVPMLHEDNPRDEMAVLIKSLQWVDWRDLRSHSLQSPGSRSAVTTIGRRLAQANDDAATIDQIPNTVQTSSHMEGSLSDEPGSVDLLAAMEEATPKLTSIIQGIGTNVKGVSSVLGDGTTRIKESDREGGGMVGRLKVIKSIAAELVPLCSQIEDLGQQYTAQLHQVDSGVTLLLDQLPDEVKNNKESAKMAKDFYSSIRYLAEMNVSAVATYEEMLGSMSVLESLSRDLRKPLQSIRKGLTLMIEGKDTIDSWVELIRE